MTDSDAPRRHAFAHYTRAYGIHAARLRDLLDGDSGLSAMETERLRMGHDWAMRLIENARHHEVHPEESREKS